MDIILLNKLHLKTIIEDGHWIWKGPRLLTRRELTYGYLTIKRKNHLIHRLSLSLFHNLDYNDARWQACHTCNRKDCWNPLHLYVGNAETNTKDRYKDRTHCKYGHLRSSDNLYLNSTGSYGCRICRDEYNRKNWKKYATNSRIR